MTRGNTLLLAAIAGLAVVGAGFLYYNNLLANKESAPEKITIGVATWIRFSPLYIAKEKGFFGKVEVDLRRIDDTAVYDSAMLRGDVDGICASMDSFATAIGGGVNGRVVYLFDEFCWSRRNSLEALYTFRPRPEGQELLPKLDGPGNSF